jgi:hypothetical protein
LDVYIKVDHLNDQIKETAHTKNWPWPTLELMTEMTGDERMALYPLTQKMSLNKQKQLIECVFDISRRQNISVQEVLDSGEFLRIRKNRNLSAIQKAEEILDLARQKRNPRLNAWKRSFEKAFENLDLPEEVNVIPAKYFEGDTISIKLDLKSREDLEKSIQKLKELSNKKEITLLFDPLTHD